MKNLSFPRLWQVIKWNSIVNRQKTLRAGIIVAIVTFLFAFAQLDMYNVLSTGERVSVFSFQYVASFFTVFIVCQFVVLAARICFNMRTKNDIVNYLMLPATKLEKYLANIFFMLIERTAITLAGMIVADLVIMLLQLVASHSCHSMILYWLTTNVGGITSVFAPASVIGILGEACDGIVSILWALSLFLLGGTFYRKHPLLLTVLTIILTPMILGTLITLPCAWIIDSLVNNGYEIVITPLVSETFVKVVVYLFIILWTCFNYWMSYRKFARLQVINNKYFN